MSLIKPAALFVCVALAGCAGKSDPADPLAKDSPVAKDKPAAQVQKSEPAAGQQGKATGASVAAAGKDAKPAQAAAKPEVKVAEQKAVKEKENSWWSFGSKKEERLAADDKGAKPAQAAAKSETKVAEQKAVKEKESSWWSFGGKKTAAQAAPVAKKVESRKVTPAWLDDNEKRLKEAVAGSKFQVERRGEILVVVAPVDSSFNPDRPSMLMPITLGPLSRVAKMVAADPQNAVLILGHADSSGNPEGNRKLSLERAQSVASIFRMSGLKNDRLMLRGVGADKPLVSNDNAKGRAQNRRVEVILTLRDSLSTLVAQNSP